MVLRQRLLKPRDRRELKDRIFEPLAQGELKIFTSAIARSLSARCESAAKKEDYRQYEY